MILVLAKKVTKLRLPNVENIIDEAINSVLKKYQKGSLKELIILEKFSYLVNEIEEEAEKIYRNYEIKAIEEYLKNKSFLTKGVINAIRAIVDNSLITSIANTRRARAGSSAQLILIKTLRELGIKCEIARFEVEGYRPDIVVPSNDAFRKDPNNVFVIAVKRTLRERWAEDIDVFKFPNSAFVLIKPDTDFTEDKAEDMVRRGMKKSYIPDKLYDEFKDYLNQLERKYSVTFRPLSLLPDDLNTFLRRISL
jgi:hypothetical protein